MEEGADKNQELKIREFLKDKRPKYEMPGPNNVALDINRFAAKYNFKIAEKIFTEA